MISAMAFGVRVGRGPRWKWFERQVCQEGWFWLWRTGWPEVSLMTLFAN